MKQMTWTQIQKNIASLSAKEQMAYLFDIIDRERTKPAGQIDYALIDACAEYADSLAAQALPQLTPGRIAQIRRRNNKLAGARRAKRAPRLRPAGRVLIAVAIMACLLCSLVVMASAKAADMSVGEYLVSVVSPTPATATEETTATETTARTLAPALTAAPTPPEFQEDVQTVIDHCHRLRMDLDLLAATDAQNDIPAALGAALEEAVAGRAAEQELPSNIVNGKLVVPAALRRVLIRLSWSYPDFAANEPGMADLMGWSALALTQEREYITKSSDLYFFYDALFPAQSDWQIARAPDRNYHITCGDFDGELLVEYYISCVEDQSHRHEVGLTYTGTAVSESGYHMVCVTPIHPLGARGESHYFFFPDDNPHFTVELVYEKDLLSLRALLSSAEATLVNGEPVFDETADLLLAQIDYGQVTREKVAEKIASVFKQHPEITGMDITGGELGELDWLLTPELVMNVTSLHLHRCSMPKGLDLSDFVSIRDIEIRESAYLTSLRLPSDCTWLRSLQLSEVGLTSLDFLRGVTHISRLELPYNGIGSFEILAQTEINSLHIKPVEHTSFANLKQLKELKSILILGSQAEYSNYAQELPAVKIYYSEP